MRTVFTTDMVAHVWAQQTQAAGRAQKGSVFFEGPTLYSYGTHFVTGHILPSGVALLNADSYSVTTSSHQSDAWRAVSHRESFKVPGLTALVRNGAFWGRKADKAALVAHVTEHALTISPDAAAYLLRLAGSRARFDAIKAKAERKAAAAKAAAAKAERDRKIRAARELATADESTYAAALAGRTRADDLANLLTSYRGYQRAAARVLSKAAKATLAARIATLAAAAAKAAWIDGRDHELRNWIREKLTLRNPAASRRTRASAAEYLARHGRGLVDAAALTAFADTERNAATREETEARERAAAERFAREAAGRAAWLAGESFIGRLSDDNGGALLRAVKVERDESGVITGGELQTSWAASVPLIHAVRAFRFLKLCNATARTWNANGRTIRVGHFAISTVTPDGFTAGCHKVNWQEVARLAASLGLADLAADESALVPTVDAAAA